MGADENATWDAIRRTIDAERAAVRARARAKA